MTQVALARFPLRSARRGGAGFTLVELMTVVAIVGVLAVVAAVSYRKYSNAAHASEATQMVSAIRAAQEKYHSEVGTYYNLSQALAAGASNHSALYPHQGTHPGNFKMGWGAPCGAGACNTGTSWATLGVQPDGPVYDGYSTIAGSGSVATASVTMNGVAMTWPGATDWYLATGVGDADGNAKYCTVLGTSYDNQIRVDMEGE